MALPSGNINVDVHPLASSPNINYQLGSIGARYAEEYKTDDGDSLIQGVHVARSKSASLYDNETMQGDWWFGKNSRVNTVLNQGDTSVPVMEAKSVLAWNEHFKAHGHATQKDAWQEGLKIRFIGTLKATRGTEKFQADNYYSFTVGRRDFNALNYWSTKDDPVRPGDHLWFHLECRLVNGRYVLELVPYVTSSFDRHAAAPLAVQHWRVGRVQHSDAISLMSDRTSTRSLPTHESNKSNGLPRGDKIQLNRVLLNQNPRIPIVLVGGAFWA